MFFIASKLLSFLLSTFTWIIAGVVISLFFKPKKWTKIIRISTIITTLLLSNHWIFNQVANRWEEPYIGQKYPNSHFTYGVVLGGMAEHDSLTNRVKFAESANRLWDALPLLNSHTIDTLILSGGSAKIIEKERFEASILKEYCQNIGIDISRILVDSLSRNTYENAVNTANLLSRYHLSDTLNRNPILLITSSYHMPRAIACFKKRGINCYALGTNSLSDINEQTLYKKLSFSMDNIIGWDRLIHEWLGFFMYKINGYC